MSILNKVNSVKSLEYDPIVKHGLGLVGQDCLAGIFSCFSYSWLACGAKLYIINNSDGSLFCSWTFGESSTEHFDVTCAVELPFEGCTIPLLILGISSENCNQICFFNPNTRRILRAIDINYPIRTLCIVEDGLNEVNPINDALTKTQGLFAVGCADGSLLIFDLCRGILLKGLSGDFGFISDEDNPVETKCMDVISVSTSTVQQKLKECYTMQDNFAIFLTDDCDEGVTELHYSFESAILFIGTSSGSFLLWNMSSLNCIFKSNPTGRAVISLSLLEPCDDPRHNLFLWICYENHPQAVMYCITFSSKFHVPGYGVYYQGFESSGIVYRLVLGLDENLVAKRAINSQSVVRAVSKNTLKSLNFLDGESYQLRLFITSYEVYDKGQVLNRAVVFDLNQWYKEQMPDEGVSLCLESVPLDGNTLCHLALDPSTVSHYQWARPLEQHFHPTALDFRLWCIEEEGIKCFEKYGLQSQWLRNMSLLGPSALLSPTPLFCGALSAGLLPLFEEPPDPECTSPNDERKYILTVCLENRAISFIEHCAKEWAAGGHPVAGCTLSLIINWLWELHGTYKNHGNRMCIPLFDQSGLGFDVSERRSLQHCKSLLCTVESLYKNIVLNYGKLVFVGGINQRLTAMSLVKFYFDCCLKLLTAKLLPEPNDAGIPRDSIPYKYDEICEFVNSKRRQGPFLGDTLIGRTGGERQWEEEGGSGRYPPPSVQSVLRYCLHPAPPLWNKLSLMLYLYMDMIHSTKSLRDLSNFDEVKNFQHLLRVPDVQYKIVTSFWFLDHSLYDEGVSLLLDPRVLPVDLSDDQHRSVLSLLAVQGQEKLALQYLRLKAPALHQPNDLRLELELLLGNRLINEAFMFQRKHPEFREQLLIQFFKGCIAKKLLGPVFGLHLDPTEERVLLKFLKTSDLEEKGDLQVLLLLSRAKYNEAITLNERLNSTINGPKARLETDTRDMIVRGVTGGLNNISRRMALEMKHYRPPPPGTCPKPLSALIKIRSEPDGPLCQADSSVLLSATAKSVRHLSDFVSSDGGKRKRSEFREDEIMEVDIMEDPPRKRFAPCNVDNGIVKQLASSISSNAFATPSKSIARCQERELMELVGTPLVKKRGKRFSPLSRPSSILKGKTPEKGLVLDDQGDTPRKTLRFALPENEKRVCGRKSLRVSTSTSVGNEKQDEESEEKKPRSQTRSTGNSSLLESGSINWSDIAASSKPRVLFSQGVLKTPASQTSHTFLDITVSSAEKKYLESPSRENDVSPVTEAVFNLTVPKRLFSAEEHFQEVDNEINGINEKYLNKESNIEKYKSLRKKTVSSISKTALSLTTLHEKTESIEQEPLSSCHNTSVKEEIKPQTSLDREEKTVEEKESNELTSESNESDKAVITEVSKGGDEIEQASVHTDQVICNENSTSTDKELIQEIMIEDVFMNQPEDECSTIRVESFMSLDASSLINWDTSEDSSSIETKEKEKSLTSSTENELNKSDSEKLSEKEVNYEEGSDSQNEVESDLVSEQEESEVSSDSSIKQTDNQEKMFLRSPTITGGVISIDTESEDEGNDKEDPFKETRTSSSSDSDESLDYEVENDYNEEDEISDSEIFGLPREEKKKKVCIKSAKKKNDEPLYEDISDEEVVSKGTVDHNKSDNSDSGDDEISINHPDDNASVENSKMKPISDKKIDEQKAKRIHHKGDEEVVCIEDSEDGSGSSDKADEVECRISDVNEEDNDDGEEENDDGEEENDDVEEENGEEGMESNSDGDVGGINIPTFHIISADDSDDEDDDDDDDDSDNSFVPVKVAPKYEQKCKKVKRNAFYEEALAYFRRRELGRSGSQSDPQIDGNNGLCDTPASVVDESKTSPESKESGNSAEIPDKAPLFAEKDTEMSDSQRGCIIDDQKEPSLTTNKTEVVKQELETPQSSNQAQVFNVSDKSHVGDNEGQLKLDKVDIPLNRSLLEAKVKKTITLEDIEKDEQMEQIPSLCSEMLSAGPSDDIEVEKKCFPDTTKPYVKYEDDEPDATSLVDNSKNKLDTEDGSLQTEKVQEPQTSEVSLESEKGSQIVHALQSDYSKNEEGCIPDTTKPYVKQLNEEQNCGQAIDNSENTLDIEGGSLIEDKAPKTVTSKVFSGIERVSQIAPEISIVLSDSSENEGGCIPDTTKPFDKDNKETDDIILIIESENKIGSENESLLESDVKKAATSEFLSVPESVPQLGLRNLSDVQSESSKFKEECIPDSTKPSAKEHNEEPYDDKVVDSSVNKALVIGSVEKRIEQNSPSIDSNEATVAHVSNITIEPSSLGTSIKSDKDPALFTHKEGPLKHIEIESPSGEVSPSSTWLLSPVARTVEESTNPKTSSEPLPCADKSEVKGYHKPSVFIKSNETSQSEGSNERVKIAEKKMTNSLTVSALMMDNSLLLDSNETNDLPKGFTKNYEANLKENNDSNLAKKPLLDPTEHSRHKDYSISNPLDTVSTKEKNDQTSLCVTKNQHKLVVENVIEKTDINTSEKQLCPASPTNVSSNKNDLKNEMIIPQVSSSSDKVEISSMGHLPGEIHSQSSVEKNKLEETSQSRKSGTSSSNKNENFAVKTSIIISDKTSSDKVNDTPISFCILPQTSDEAVNLMDTPVKSGDSGSPTQILGNSTKASVTETSTVNIFSTESVSQQDVNVLQSETVVGNVIDRTVIKDKVNPSQETSFNINSAVGTSEKLILDNKLQKSSDNESINDLKVCCDSTKMDVDFTGEPLNRNILQQSKETSTKSCESAVPSIDSSEFKHNLSVCETMENVQDSSLVECKSSNRLFIASAPEITKRNIIEGTLSTFDLNKSTKKSDSKTFESPNNESVTERSDVDITKDSSSKEKSEEPVKISDGDRETRENLITSSTSEASSPQIKDITCLNRIEGQVELSNVTATKQVLADDLSGSAELQSSQTGNFTDDLKMEAMSGQLEPSRSNTETKPIFSALIPDTNTLGHIPETNVKSSENKIPPKEVLSTLPTSENLEKVELKTFPVVLSDQSHTKSGKTDMLKSGISKTSSPEKVFFFGNNDNSTFLRASKATFQVGRHESISSEDEPINPMETAMIEEVIEDEEELVEEDEETDPRNTCMLDVDLSLHLSEDDFVQGAQPKKVDKSMSTTDTYLQRKSRRSRKVESSISNDVKGRKSTQIEPLGNSGKAVKPGVNELDKKSFSTQTSDTESGEEKDVRLKPKESLRIKSTEPSTSTSAEKTSTSQEITDKKKSQKADSNQEIYEDSPSRNLRRSTRDSEIKGILKNKGHVGKPNSDIAKDLRVQVLTSSGDQNVLETDAEAISRNRASRTSYITNAEDKDVRTDPYEIVENMQKKVNVKRHRRSSVNSQNSDDAKDLRINQEEFSEATRRSRRSSADPEIRGILKKTVSKTKTRRASEIIETAGNSKAEERVSRLSEVPGIEISSNEKQERRGSRKSSSKCSSLSEAEGRRVSLRESNGTELRGILKKRDSKSSRHSCTSETSGELSKRLKEDFPEDKRRSRRYSEEPELQSILKRTDTLHKRSRRSVHACDAAQELHSRFEENLEHKRSSRRHSIDQETNKREGSRKQCSASQTSDTATDLRIRMEKDFPENKKKSSEIHGILKNKIDPGERQRSSYRSETDTDLRLSPDGHIERRRSRRRSVDQELTDEMKQDISGRRSRRLSNSSETSDIRDSRESLSDCKNHSRKSLLLGRYKKEEDKKVSERSSISSDQATDLRLRIEEDFPDVHDHKVKHSECKRMKKTLSSDDLTGHNYSAKRQRHSLSTDLHKEPKAKYKRSSLGSYSSENSECVSQRLEEDFPEESLQQKSRRKSMPNKSGRGSIKSHESEDSSPNVEKISKRTTKRESLLGLPSEESTSGSKKARSLQDFPIRRSTRFLPPILEDIKEEDEETPRKKRRSLDDLDVAAFEKKNKSVPRKKQEEKTFPPLVIESDSDLEASPLVKELWTTENYAKERRLTRNQKKVLLRNQQFMESTPSPSTSTTPTMKQSRRKTPVPESPPKTPTRTSLRLQKKPPSESD